MYVDFKETVWFRVKFPDDITKEELHKVISDIKSGKIDSSSELQNELNYYEGEYLEGTYDSISPKNNSGCSTIEIYNNKDEKIWNNQIDQ